jgi:predicted RNA methylase
MNIFYKITLTIVVLSLIVAFTGIVIHSIEILQLGVGMAVFSFAALVLGAIWD